MKKKYKAFISYKYTTSRVFAQNLELAIKAYAKPIWAPPMRIFRDEKYLSPGLNLPNMIEDGLNQSEYLIYLASPEAVASVWVEDEFKRWLQKDPALEKLIIVLTDGSIAYDSKSKKIDWQNTNVLPEILKNTLVYVPFYIDCHTFQNEDVQTLGNAEFKRAINQIHARIMGIDPIEMSGIEVKQYRSNLFKRNILLTSFGLAVIGAGISYMNKLEQEKLASSNLFVATSQMLAQGSKPQVGKAVIQAIKGVQLSLSQISVDNLQAINAFLPSHSWEFEVKNDSDDRSLGAVKVREKDNQRQVVLKHSANNAVVLDIKTGKQLSSIEYSKTFSLKEAVTDEKVYPTYDPQDGIVAEQHGQYIQLQNVSKGQIAASFKIDTSDWKSWEIRHRGSILAVYTKSRNVFIVNYKNEEIVKRILPFGERCYCTIALSPEGKYLAVSTTNQIVEGGYQIEIFDTNTLQVVKTIENLGSQALEMYFSQSKSQPQLVVSRNNSQELQLHDLFGRRPIINFSGISRPKMVVFSRDNNLMAAVNDNTGAVSIFDVRNGQLLIRTPKRYELIHDVVFSRDGKKLFVAGSISGGQDTLRLDAWDLENNDNLFATRLRDRGDGSALVFHPVDPVMGVSTDDYSIVDIIDRSNGHFISSFDADPDGKLGLIGASGLAFTPDGRYLIATHWSHLVSVWEYNSRRLLWQGSNISSPLDKQVWPQKGKLPSISNFSLLVRQISGNLNSIGGKTNVNSNGSVSVHWTQSECIITIKRQGDDTIDKVIIPIHLDEECSQIEALSINTEGTKLAVGFISDETGLFSAPKILILDFSPYITKLACGFTVNCSRWRVIKKLSAIDQIDDIKFSKSGMFLAVRDSSGQITVFDGIKFIPYRTFSGIEGSTFPSPPSLVFSDDDHWLATGFGQFGGPMRWRLDGAEIINTVEGKMPNWLH